MQDTKKEGGLWISREIYQLDLNDGLKILLAIIDNLDNGHRGCFASDKHLAKLLRKSIPTVQTRLRDLEGLKLIQRTSIDGQRSIKPILSLLKNEHSTTQKRVPPLLKNEHITTQKRVPPLLKNEHYNKEINKELIKRESTLSHFEILNSAHPDKIKAIKKKYPLDSNEWNLCVLKFNAKKNNGLTIVDFETYINNWKNNLKTNQTESDRQTNPNNGEAI